MTEKIKWPLVGRLIFLNAAIIISWIAYHNYQPELLKRFGFIELEPTLQFAKLLIMATIPPLAGFIADRLRQKDQNKLPLLSAAVGFTALIFMVVAAIISPINLQGLEPALPFLFVIWLISMNLFFAPALATLEQLVPQSQLIVVMGVYVLISDLLYAMEPVVVMFVNWVGAALTFVTGGILIGLSGYLFNSAYQRFNVAEQNEDNTESKFLNLIGIALGLGVSVGFVLNVLPELFDRFDQQLFASPSILASVVLVLTSFIAFVASRTRIIEWNSRVFTITLFSAFLLLAACTLLPLYGLLLASILLSVPLGILSVMGFPLAMQQVNAQDKMLAAGIFIAGLEVPDSFFEMVV